VRARPRILVVDDDAFIRRPLEFILHQEGFEPITAANGDECLERIATETPDLIILDVMMPGRDGFELCRTIKREARYAAIPVILLSARGQGHDRERGLCLGAADFLTKPYSPSELVRRVREILSDDD
jgi:two-component system alkaline phosphatase synthesis response regulator PhoP